jgi:PKD repeat protein
LEAIDVRAPSSWSSFSSWGAVRVSVVVLAALAIAATLAGSAQAATANPRGHFLGVVPVHGTQAAPLAPSNLSYHNGPVMHSDANYSIYWEPPASGGGGRGGGGGIPTPGFNTPASYKSVIDSFFVNVGHDSGGANNVYSVATEYSDTAGPIAYNASFGGRIVDTSPYPPSGCPSPSGTPCLTDAQIQAELANVITANHLPHGMNTVYYVFTPPSVDSCFDGSGSACTYNVFCAYHGSIGSGTTATLYANMPYAARPGCDPGQSPNSDPADATLNVVSHENIETITDPLGTGWWDGIDGSEIGDKCNFNFGAALGGVSGSFFNQIIGVGSSHYWLQQEWSNRASGCLQRATGTDPLPIASFTFSPSAPITGQNVTFNGSGSRDPAGGSITGYSWAFGDGTTATGVSATHAYAIAGTYTVKLTVTDSDSETASTTRTIIVTSTDKQPVAAFTFSPGSPTVGQPVAFDGSGSNDPAGGSIAGYSWAFGDGATATGVSPTYSYGTPGTYTVTLTVTDSDSETATTTQTVTVGQGGRCPFC